MQIAGRDYLSRFAFIRSIATGSDTLAVLLNGSFLRNCHLVEHCEEISSSICAYSMG